SIRRCRWPGCSWIRSASGRRASPPIPYQMDHGIGTGSTHRTDSVPIGIPRMTGGGWRPPPRDFYTNPAKCLDGRRGRQRLRHMIVDMTAREAVELPVDPVAVPLIEAARLEVEGPDQRVGATL